MSEGSGNGGSSHDLTDLLRIARRLKAERDSARQEVARLRVVLSASEKVLAVAIDAALERNGTDT
jgi:hypothetical protein